MGRITISISSVLGPPHAHRAMGLLQVKPEGGEGERDGVQEGGLSCSQGRSQSAPRCNQKKLPWLLPTREHYARLAGSGRESTAGV